VYHHQTLKSEKMIGSILGNYRILKKIGEGGMGAVYLARDLSLEREVAIKIIAPELARNPALMARFRVEAIAQAKLNHTNIVTIHSFDQEKDSYFIVMEHVDGKNLRAVIKESGKIPVVQALKILAQLLEGMGYAHSRGIVHRDIKPSNIFLTSQQIAKIGDFGIAKVEGIEGLTKIGTTLGSPVYSSPEQLLGKQVDARTDVYSLGMTLYEMLTGAPPLKLSGSGDYHALKQALDFIPPKPSTSNPDIPGSVDEIVMKSIARELAQRYHSAKEMGKDVKRLLSSLTPVPAVPGRPGVANNIPGKIQPPASRSRSGVKGLKSPLPRKNLAVILVLAVALVVIVVFLLISGTDNPLPVQTGSDAPPSTLAQPDSRGSSLAEMPRIIEPDKPDAIEPPSLSSPGSITAVETPSVSGPAAIPQLLKEMAWLIRNGHYKKAINRGLSAVNNGTSTGGIYQKIAQAYFYDGQKDKARLYALKALEADQYLRFNIGYLYRKDRIVYGTLAVSQQNLSFEPSLEKASAYGFSLPVSQVRKIYDDLMSDITDIFKKRKNRKNPILVIRDRKKNKYMLQLKRDDNKLRDFIKVVIKTLMKGS
jgi:serine/threonine protein kinase